MAKKKELPDKSAADYASEWFTQYYMDDDYGGYIPRHIFVNYIRNHSNNLEWQFRKEAERIDKALSDLSDAHASIRRLAERKP